MEKSYYYQLAQTKNYNLSAMARIAKQGRATIRRKFERWGWVKMFVVPEEPQTLILLPPAPPPASAGPVPPVPSAPSASAPR